MISCYHRAGHGFCKSVGRGLAPAVCLLLWEKGDHAVVDEEFITQTDGFIVGDDVLGVP